MRKVLTVTAIAAGLTLAAAGTAAAHNGTAGPFSTLSLCKEAQKKYALDDHKVAPCYETKQGWFFQYADL